MDKLDKEVKDIIKNIQSYENEESCIIILSQEQNNALLNYINNLEKDNGDFIKLFAKEREETKRLHSIIKGAREYIESKNNGICYQNGIEKGAYTFVLNFDEAREFIWNILEILDKENK